MPSKATAKPAAKAEALNESVTFDFDGDTYVVNPDMAKDLDVLEAFEDGRLIAGTRQLIGAAQYRKFRARHQTADGLNTFIEALQAALGISGN